MRRFGLNGWAWSPLAVAVVVSLGVGLRAARIDDSSLWVDEAESSINGLTILEHGLPVDHYLGLPIYENSLVRPWPESVEYEFRDLSYSDKGVAVYHGWLPLYAIALSQGVFGIEPDRVDELPAVRHDEAEIVRRTWVPRVPSVIVSALFLALMYVTAREIAGDAAAWASLVFSAFNERLVWFGSQARYYAYTLAFDALCAWTLWQCVSRGRWRDFLAFAGSLVLLFFTHSLSCIAVIATALCMLPFLRHHEKVIRKVGASVVIFGIGTLPWIWLSGLAAHADRLPKSRELLTWPDDALQFLIRRPESLTLLAASVACLALRRLTIGRSDSQEAARLRLASRGAVMACLWMVIAYASFLLLMPAASFFWMRMTMTLEVPGILLVSIGVATLSRALVSRIAPSVAVALAIVLGFLILSGRFAHISRGPDDMLAAVRPVIDHLRESKLSPETRLYASPNSHLVWTYYTGLPIQSIAPVRSTFLNAYPGPILFIERFGLDWLTEDKLDAVALEHGVPIDVKLRRRWFELLQSQLYVETIRNDVAAIDGSELLPAFLEPVLIQMRLARDGPRSSSRYLAECPLMMQNHRVTTHRDWWQTFFYRFVDPESRKGACANFAQRFRDARVKIFAGECSVSHVPPLPR